MIFLYSTISSKSIFVIVVSLRQASALIAPAGHLHRFLDAWELAGCSFPLCCVSPRTSPCLSLSPLVSFACLWLCSSLALLLSCLLLGLLFCLLLALFFCLLLALLFSVLFIFAPDLRVLLAVLVPLLLYFVLLATGSLAVVPSVVLLQSHFVVGHDSVARFWLPPNITTQHCALRD